MDNFKLIQDKQSQPISQDEIISLFKDIEYYNKLRWSAILSSMTCINYLQKKLKKIKDGKIDIKEVYLYDIFEDNVDKKYKKFIKIFNRVLNTNKKRYTSKSILNLILQIQFTNSFYNDLLYFLHKANRKNIFNKITNINESIKCIKNKLVIKNVRLIFSVAKKYINENILLDDLMQEGYIGLMNAIDRYDYTMPNKFSTYIMWYIKQKILSFISIQSNNIRVPNHIISNNHKIINEAKKFIKENDKIPNTVDLVNNMGVKSKNMKFFALSSLKSVSMEYVIYDSPLITIGNILSNVDSTNPESIAEQKDLYNKINNLLKKLGPKEEKLLRLRYGIKDINN